MISEEIKHLLSQYIDNQLDDTKRREVEEYLEKKPEIRQYYQQLLELEKKADELTLGGDESFWTSQKDSILEKIEQEEKSDKKKIVDLPKSRFNKLSYKIIAVAASIALVAFVSIFESQRIDTTRPIFGDKEQKVVLSHPPVTDTAPKQKAAETGEPVQDEIPTQEKLSEIQPAPEKIEPQADLYEAEKQADEIDADAEKIEKHEPAPQHELAEPKLDQPPTAKPEPAMKPAEFTPEQETPVIKKSQPSPEQKQKSSIDLTSGKEGGKSVTEKIAMPTRLFDSLDRARTGILPEENKDISLSISVKGEKSGVAASQEDTVSLSGLTQEQKESYYYWRNKADSESRKYDEILAGEKNSKNMAADKIMSSKSSRLDDTELLEIAHTFHEFGKITPVENERIEMIEKLRHLRRRASSGNTVKKIEQYINDLENL